MDWIERLNKVAEYIEENLTGDIQMEKLSRIAYCSVYEFSRVFSFAAGMSVSEYIRRRRLSQAVFDIQNGNGNESLIDIALKYRYESQSAFTRAFKELHGQTPAAARNSGVLLKTYPKITFKLIIRGVTEMDFRIENKESFRIIGYKSPGDWEHWNKFFEHFEKKLGEGGYYKAPLWQVWVFKNIPAGSYYHGEDKDMPKDCNTIVGAEYNGEPLIEGMEIEEFSAATWAVFPVVHDPDNDATGRTVAKVMTEWFPVSNYKRNENLPYLEVFPTSTEPGEIHYDEVWIPVISK